MVPLEYNEDDFRSDQKVIWIWETTQKNGIVNISEKVFVPLEYDEKHDFSDGLAKVKKNGKWGFIDKTGNVVIPHE